jgi:hypothetical protein
MSTFRILPYGNMIQAVETDGTAQTLTTVVFSTKAKAREWTLGRMEAIAKLGRQSAVGESDFVSVSLLSGQ